MAPVVLSMILSAASRKLLKTVTGSEFVRPLLVICWQIAGNWRFFFLRGCDRPGAGPGLACGSVVDPPRRNRTGDPVLTMEPPGTAVRTAVSPAHARP